MDLSHEMQTVQSAHAAFESACEFGGRKKDHETYLVLLGVPDEESLLAAQRRLSERGLRSYCFFEPDGDVGYSALASELVTTRSKRRLFFPYPVLRHGTDHAPVDVRDVRHVPAIHGGLAQPESATGRPVEVGASTAPAPTVREWYSECASGRPDETTVRRRPPAPPDPKDADDTRSAVA